MFRYSKIIGIISISLFMVIKVEPAFLLIYVCVCVCEYILFVYE